MDRHTPVMQDGDKLQMGCPYHLSCAAHAAAVPGSRSIGIQRRAPREHLGRKTLKPMPFGVITLDGRTHASVTFCRHGM